MKVIQVAVVITVACLLTPAVLLVLMAAGMMAVAESRL
jgi:hypothetical protein